MTYSVLKVPLNPNQPTEGPENVRDVLAKMAWLATVVEYGEQPVKQKHQDSE